MQFSLWVNFGHSIFSDMVSNFCVILICIVEKELVWMWFDWTVALLVNLSLSLFLLFKKKNHWKSSVYETEIDNSLPKDTIMNIFSKRYDKWYILSQTQQLTVWDYIVIYFPTKRISLQLYCDLFDIVTKTAFYEICDCLMSVSMVMQLSDVCVKIHV